MEIAALLASPHLNVITRHADSELQRIQHLVEHKVLVDGRDELEEALGRLLAGMTMQSLTPSPKTLDLVGHSTPGKSLLSLGSWVIDAQSPTVTAFFRGLADHEVLPRLGVVAMRLIGCETADSGAGRSTIVKLSQILDMEVVGTRALVYSAHYNRYGLVPDCEHILVGSSELQRESRLADHATPPEPATRALDLDALPTVSLPLLTTSKARCSRRFANPAETRAILRLVRRTRGVHMPGLLAAPTCELALPASRPHEYCLVQVLLDGQLVRAYPDGDAAESVLYPVEDPPQLREILETLSTMP